MKKIVIAGGGLSALMTANMLLKYGKEPYSIYVINKEEKYGGLFGSIDYKEHGLFDYGMHIYYDSCIPEIDDLVTQILPEGEWNIMEGNLKDAAGLFINGKLQLETPYIDLRDFPEQKVGEYLISMISNLDSDRKLSDTPSAYEVLEDHFGKLITDEIFVPVFEKLYSHHLSNLDPMILKLTTVNRLAILESKAFLELSQSDAIRARICFPDQFNMPPFRTNNQRALYPKKYGFYKVIETLKTSLADKGVKFYTGTKIEKIETNNNTIENIEIRTSNGIERIEDVDALYWGLGLPPLAKTLNIDMSDLKNDKRPKAYFVNFLFDKPVNMGKLYYFYCFEKGYRSFRITNYSNYCENASKDRGYPLCVEFWPGEDDNMDSGEIINKAIQELKDFKVIDDSHAIEFSDCLQGGDFPIPTKNNIENIGKVRDRIKELNIENLYPISVLAEPNVFFISDVLPDALKKIQKYIS